MYIHESNTWPEFTWREKDIADTLTRVRYQQGRLVGKMEALGFDLRREATLNMLTEDVLKSSEIEGEVRVLAGRARKFWVGSIMVAARNCLMS